MNTYYSQKNVRSTGYVTTASSINSTKKKKTIQYKDETDVVRKYLDYINRKTKQYSLVKKYKHKPRPELIHNLLTQTEADKQSADIPKNTIINSNEYNTLCQLYQNGHKEWKKGNSPNQDYNTLKANGIDLRLLNEYEREKSLKKRSNTIENTYQELLTTNYGNGFNSQYDSFKCLNVNKQLVKKIYLKQSEEQINQFISQGLFKEELNLKSSLMPNIRTTLIGGGRERLTEGAVAQSTDIASKHIYIMSLLEKTIKNETYSRKSIFSIDSVFAQYSLLYISIKSHFKLTPSSRSQMKMALYIRESDDQPIIYLYGGVNQHRLDELWKCTISQSKELEKDLVFKWKQVLTSTGNPLACSGHSMSIYKDQLIIYGGIVNNLRTINIIEDPLIYSIPNKKYTTDKCKKELQVSIWRRNHIAEVIGKNFIIFGGIHEDTGIRNDVWTLDLIKLKWSKVLLNGQPPFLYSMASCLVIYNHHKNTEPLSLYKLPQLSELLPPSPLKHEGIYVFGGIDSNGRCVNNLFIMKIGKPMQIIQPSSSGLPPTPRSDCSMNFYEKLNSFVLHGGKDISIKGGCYFNDFYFYDIIHFQWTRMKTNSLVPHRAEHCSVVYDDFLIIFGGCDGHMFLKSDILMVNLNIIENSNAEMNPFELYKENMKNKLNLRNRVNHLPMLTTDEIQSVKSVKKGNKVNANKQMRTVETNEDLPQKYFDHFHFISKQIKQKVFNVKDECQDLRLKNKRFND